MKKVLIILGILLAFNILAWIGVFQLSQPGLEVTFFNVGQGDSIFIETPERNQILIDGGPDNTVIEKLGKEMPFWDRTIDLVILTHPERDHLSGLLEVLKRYEVQNILWTGVVRDTAEYQEWRKLIEEEGANIYIAKAGQQIEGGRTLLNILYPFESLEGQEMKDSNKTSVIARLVFGDHSFLFTGDATKAVEKALVEKGAGINSDVLKAGHHGSKTSNSEEFIKAVSPETAVISVGKDNTYGHPHPEVLEIFKNYGTKVFRTDLNGDIEIIVGEKTYDISSI